jgi:hypothetical protein
MRLALIASKIKEDALAKNNIEFENVLTNEKKKSGVL